MFDPLTPQRREFLARSIMDMLKYVVLGAFASGFFVQLGFWVQVAMAIAVPLIFVLAWMLFPPKGGH